MEDLIITDFKPGQRVELSPATGAWMSRDRFGEVVKVGRKNVHVKMDRSGRTLAISPSNIHQIIR